MNKWRFLVGGVSVAQLAWGVLAFSEDSRSFGGADASGWFLSGLGLTGLLVLAVPRAGYPVAAGQLAVAAYGLWCCGIGVVLLSALPPGGQPPLGVPLPPVVLVLFAMAFGTLALLCGLSAVGSWQIARRTRHCT